MNPVQPILLVENDIVDVMTVKRALKEIDVSNPLEVAYNGEEGLAYLLNEKNKTPAIILLDLNMPRMNGVEFMQHVKSDARLRRIPIIVLTTSNQEQDRLTCFDNQVAGYMVKPVDYKQFIEVIRTIHSYWTISETA